MTTQHGWQPCRACHQAGQDVRIEGDWHLRANPGYWGAQAPRVLVLGFSKGATQIAAAAGGQFDAVAFAGMRPRLKAVLDGLGLDLDGQSIDEAMSAGARALGAASLIRCGLSVMENGQLKSSGTIMPKAAKASFPLQAMKTCIGRHLNPLPESVETVVMLGTTDAYVKGVKGLMREQFSDLPGRQRRVLSRAGPHLGVRIPPQRGQRHVRGMGGRRWVDRVGPQALVGAGRARSLDRLNTVSHVTSCARFSDRQPTCHHSPTSSPHTS